MPSSVTLVAFRGLTATIQLVGTAGAAVCFAVGAILDLKPSWFARNEVEHQASQWSFFWAGLMWFVAVFVNSCVLKVTARCRGSPYLICWHADHAINCVGVVLGCIGGSLVLPLGVVCALMAVCKERNEFCQHIFTDIVVLLILACDAAALGLVLVGSCSARFFDTHV